MKYKYAGYLPKIQKILLAKYQLKAPIEYCLSRFLINFFHNWEDLTCAIVSDVTRSDRYALDLVWYICHSLVEGANLDKQPAVLDYLTTNFEEPMRHYEVMQSVEARKLTEIVFLLNIQGCQELFRRHSLSWKNKFRMFLESSSGDSHTTLLMEVLKNKNLLQSRQESFEFWSQQANAFLVLLESRISGMRVENAVDRQFLDLLTWLLEFREFREILLADETRFLRSLLSCMRPKEDNLEHVFHLKKYQEISISAPS